MGAAIDHTFEPCHGWTVFWASGDEQVRENAFAPAATFEGTTVPDPTTATATFKLGRYADGDQVLVFISADGVGDGGCNENTEAARVPGRPKTPRSIT